MAKLQHRSVTATDNHVIQGWEVADASARAALALTAADVGRVARQASDGSLWVCVGYSPAKWSKWGVDWVNVADFGAVCDGVTDDTVAVQAAFDAAMALGREVRFPAATCRIDGQLVLMNDGATPPKQRPLRIVGSGAHMSGRGTAINGGTVLDMRYAATYGKIQTSALGLLEITGVTFTDSSGGSAPWLYTTNTTLHVHGCGFVGSKSGTACDQDAIILGGTTEVEGGGGLNDGFQGYGTVIRDNFFMKVRRLVYGRTFANGVVVRDNTVWSNCGSNLAGGAAIEFDNPAVGATQYDTGNVIAGNLIEITNYPYAIKLGRAAQNTISGNNIFDAGAVSLAAVRLEASSIQNVVFDGYIPGSLAKVSDATTGGVNTHVAIDQGVASRFGTKGTYVFAAEGDGVVQESATSSVPFSHFRTPGGDAVYMRRGGAAGSPGFLICVKPSGGSEQVLGFVQTAGTGQSRLQLWGATYAGLEAPDGDLTLKPKAGNVIRLGSSSAPSERFGTGAPSADDAVGSAYRRTDSARAFYVKRAGGASGWSPVDMPALVTLTYAASMDIDASAGRTFKVVASDSNAFAFTAPTNGIDGQRITIEIKATATLSASDPFPSANTWRSAAWTPPANGNTMMCEFECEGGKWYQRGSRIAVPN